MIFNPVRSGGRKSQFQVEITGTTSSARYVIVNGQRYKENAIVVAPKNANITIVVYSGDSVQFNGVNCFMNVTSDNARFAVPLLTDYKIEINYSETTITSE